MRFRVYVKTFVDIEAANHLDAERRARSIIRDYGIRTGDKFTSHVQEKCHCGVIGSTWPHCKDCGQHHYPAMAC